MTRNGRWIGSVGLALALTAGSAEAQFYGGGYWGEGFGGVGTPQGELARGEGMFAMGLGRYNLDTAKAEAIDAATMKRWNEYLYHSRLEAARLFRERQARQEQNRREGAEAVRLRLRNAPNQVDISSGNSLNLTLDELGDPRVFSKAVYSGSKMKLGGESIRDIPFRYGAAAISTSVQGLVKGQPPASLRRPEFAEDLTKLRALIGDVGKEIEDQGEVPADANRKVREQVAAIRAKAEQVLPATSQDLRDARRYLKALNGLSSMLDTPAVGVLLAGVESRPEATVGDLVAFMYAYNLRFGAATTPRQRQIYQSLHPLLVKIRDEVTPDVEPTPVTPGGEQAPGLVFDTLGDRSAEGKAPRSR